MLIMHETSKITFNVKDLYQNKVGGFSAVNSPVYLLGFEGRQVKTL